MEVFLVRLVLMDMEFEENFDKVKINTTTAYEHVCEIKQCNRMVKERSQGRISEMRDVGFNFFHKMIVVHCIYFVVKLLNAVPARLGISEKFALAEIILGWNLDAKKGLMVRFGVYFEVSCDLIITNDMMDRKHPCISLGSSGNIQGLLKCFNLLTRKVVIYCTFKEFPYTRRYNNLANNRVKSSHTKEYVNKLNLLD